MSRSSKKCNNNNSKDVMAEYTVSGTTLQQGRQGNNTTTTTATHSTSAAAAASSTTKKNNTSPCLHCGKRNGNTSIGIQVSCDECSAYVCNDCHWCHEFQANHEIRVCDRCDGFYCKACDEMDQCEDCGEVVCGACSSLLSCKFCGCGLCPDCATACGKCGIVLCSRDAKFAVECDICKLSYCLVCLASSNKDPCVRCGHRPSKRMEQLVHLRLKSIYKAFQQTSSSSSTSNRKSSGGSGSGSRYGRGGNRSDRASTRAVAAAAAAAAACGVGTSSSSTSKTTGSRTGTTSASAAASAFFRSSSSSTRDNAKYHHDDSDDDNDQDDDGCSMSREDEEKTFSARQAEADLAAAELLAELDEEEQVQKKKLSKKKRKKAAQKKKKVVSVEETEEEEEETVAAAAASSGAAQHGASSTTSPTLSSALAQEGRRDNGHAKDSSKMTTTRRTTSTTSNVSKQLDNVIEEEDVPSPPEEDEEEQEEKMDPDEVRLYEMVADGDGDGIEALLAEFRGVPGKAALRKNAKKALKRLKEEKERVKQEKEEAEQETGFQKVKEPAAATSAAATTSTASAPKTAAAAKDATTTTTTTTSSSYKPPEPLLTLVSRNVHSNTKSECVLHMSPQVVGWVIGKGGQRIRDLMDDSGSKVWIDQDSMGPNDARIVYVSGQGKAVDDAVRRIKDLVAKAPVGATTAGMTVTSSSQATSASNKKSQPSSDVKSMEGGGGGGGASSAVPSKPSPGRARSSSMTSKDKDREVHEITCEPRFVPLLIGRRGWTIKHIQDSSGARVDIDQSVTPRRIKISGKKDCVAIAIRMVKDVLSYPHAQLDKSSSGGPPPAAKPAKATVPAAAVPVAGAAADSEPLNAPSKSPAGPQPQPPAAVGGTGANELESVEVARNLSNHSPPPSSLIMTGDAKSTVSASSSLSSTPEPSMASTSKSSSYKHPGPLSSADVIPPNFASPAPPFLQTGVGAHQAREPPPLSMPSPAGSSGGLPLQQPPAPHDIRFVNNPPQVSRALSYGQQPSSPFNQQRQLQAGMPFGHPPQQQGQQALHHANSAPIGGLGAPGFDNRDLYGQQQPIGGSSLLRDALMGSTQQQQQQNVTRQEPIGQSGVPQQQQQQQQGHPMSSFQSDSYPSAPLLFQKQDAMPGGNVNDTEAFASDLFGRSRKLQGERSSSEHGTMDHASSPYFFRGERPPHRQNSDSQIPPHMYADQQQHQAAARRSTMPMHGSGMADSDIVDSLFGPTGGGAEQSLLSGIQGLNLNSAPSGSGWGSAIGGWGSENGHNAGGGVPRPDQTVSDLNGGIMHGLQQQQQQQQQQNPPAQQSRFDWG